MHSRRLFFALWPDEAQGRQLAQAAQNSILSCGGRLIATENFHVTVAFLGNVEQHKMADLLSAAGEVAGRSGRVPIQLTFDRIEYWKKAKVLCATASAPSPAAACLAEALKSRLVASGFTPDLKPFRAHVTLARKVPSGSRERAMHSVCWSFTSCALVDSRTGPAGALYSILHSWILCGESTENP